MSEQAGRRRELTVAILASAAAGAVAVGVGLYAASGDGGRADSVPVPPIATEEYGRRLVAHTAELLGPDQPDSTLRYSNSRLNCGSCHLGAGAEPGALTLQRADEHYPRYSGRTGTMTDIEDRINECMQRSMNGAPLPRSSPEMLAIAAYLRSLRAQYEATGASGRRALEPEAFKTPARAANLASGTRVFESRCTICHGADGQGLLASEDRRKGYVFPPLWGPDSFNDGAGMHRLLTAARFIKARMPLGDATLSDDEAFDVAAFLNEQPRPQMANLDRDYPDRTTKPVDNPYGPYADDFALEQHRLGPFQPIEAYYKALETKK